MTAVAAAAEQTGWLTLITRPAGALDRAALGRLGAALGQLAASTDMVIVDLTAADVRSPRVLARNLRMPARSFEQAGRCLLLVGASAELAAELDHANVPVITLALPDQLGAIERDVEDGSGHSVPFRRFGSRS
jgi:hypothetical protein